MQPTALAELAREVVCVGFDGTDSRDVPLEMLRELGAKTTILFARNVVDRDQLARLVADLHAALDEPLVTVDQEGGQVARIRDGVAELPAMMALGATRDETLARRAGRKLGSDLRGLGVGLDFAPVLDLALEPRNTVIGARAFGTDPELVATLGIAFARGLMEAGVVPVVKHFPGHGATEIDSHLALPSVTVDARTWRERDARPFARAVDAGLPAVMTAHVLLEAFDAGRPATLSPAIVQGLLRTELGFEGVVFSDDLEMNAIAATVGVANAAVGAIAAGVDCVIVSHHLELARDAIAAIESAAAGGVLARSRLEEAASRMRRLRTSPLEASRSADADVGLEIARGAVTVLRGSLELAEGSAVTVISFEGKSPNSLSSALRARRLRSEIMRVPLDPAEDDVRLLEGVLRGQGDRRVIVVARRAHLHPQQARAIGRVLDVAPNAILISAREPFDIALFPQARNAVCIYDDGAVSFEGLSDVIVGRHAASGTLPIRLDPANVR